MIAPLLDQTRVPQKPATPQPPVGQDTPLRSDRRFAALLDVNDGRGADAVGLPAPNAADRVATIAQRFNEHGFFGRAVADSEDARAAPPRTVTSALARLCIYEMQLVSPSGTTNFGPPANAGSEHGDASLPAAMGVQTRANGLVEGAIFHALSSAPPGKAAKESAELEGVSLARRSALPPRAVQQVSLRLRETEAGLEVIATVARADDIDVDGLCDEIGWMLARHGRVAARIAIVGRADSSDQSAGERHDADE